MQTKPCLINIQKNWLNVFIPISSELSVFSELYASTQLASNSQKLLNYALGGWDFSNNYSEVSLICQREAKEPPQFN